MIFFTITGSWTAAVIYDRREKKRIQKKWRRVVEHIAQEPLGTHQLPRKLTIFLAAPPADGLVPARDHFNEYIKPILVGAAVDWDAIEGRREGDVRAGLAERIRKLRKNNGEANLEPVEEDLEDLLQAVRKRAGTTNWDGIGGDIVIGRHTWKEYVRALHEGWLGPIDAPAITESEDISALASLNMSKTELLSSEKTADPANSSATADRADLSSESKALSGGQGAAEIKVEAETQKDGETGEKEASAKKKKKIQLPAFIRPEEYDKAVLAPSCPPTLGPVAIVPIPHLLGFFNFPIRMYRFLNKRATAEEIGREVAAAVLGIHRPFNTLDRSHTTVSQDEDEGSHHEQQQLLQHEEPDWHKTARKRDEDDISNKERVWLDPMVLDTRIEQRMRRFVLGRDAEERARSMLIDSEDSWLALWKADDKVKKAWEGLVEDE